MQPGNYVYHPGTLECNHCHALIGWPRWARIEPGRYQALCWDCFDRIDETFTAEQAVYQALIVIGLWQGAHPIGGVQ